MLNVKLVNRGTEGELFLIGRLDTNSAGDAETIFNDVSARFDTLILNLQDLEYVSSAGLRALKRVHIAMRRKGGSLAIKNTSKMVMEFFKVTVFAGMLKFI